MVGGAASPSMTPPASSSRFRRGKLRSRFRCVRQHVGQGGGERPRGVLDRHPIWALKIGNPPVVQQFEPHRSHACVNRRPSIDRLRGGQLFGGHPVIPTRSVSRIRDEGEYLMDGFANMDPDRGGVHEAPQAGVSCHRSGICRRMNAMSLPRGRCCPASPARAHLGDQTHLRPNVTVAGNRGQGGGVGPVDLTSILPVNALER